MKDADVRWRNITEEATLQDGYMGEHPNGFFFHWREKSGWTYCSGRSSAVYGFSSLTEAIEAEDQFYRDNVGL